MIPRTAYGYEHDGRYVGTNGSYGNQSLSGGETLGENNQSNKIDEI